MTCDEGQSHGGRMSGLEWTAPVARSTLRTCGRHALLCSALLCSALLLLPPPSRTAPPHQPHHTHHHKPATPSPTLYHPTASPPRLSPCAELISPSPSAARPGWADTGGRAGAGGISEELDGAALLCALAAARLFSRSFARRCPLRSPHVLHAAGASPAGAAGRRRARRGRCLLLLLFFLLQQGAAAVRVGQWRVVFGGAGAAAAVLSDWR